MILPGKGLLAERAARKEWQRLAEAKVGVKRELSSLQVRFVIDYYGADETMRTEPGVSYLVDAGGRKVLFDLGYNQEGSAVSPLAENWSTLGLTGAQLDAVVISHNHLDHVGGLRRQRQCLPDLEQLGSETGAVPVWTPVPLRHPHARAVWGPCEVVPGLMTTGPLPASLFFLGRLQEQALLGFVRKRGVVLITGCGHPGIVEMVKHARRSTGRTVFAVVGGLHLIASRGRTKTQKYLGASCAPWQMPGRAGVEAIAHELRGLGVETVVPSAHDSCDETLAIFEEVFGSGYIPLRVGDEVTFKP